MEYAYNQYHSVCVPNPSNGQGYLLVCIFYE